jgi:NAD(P)-dependent dehydrogenase (short-subunit alcohol dehydrogenase family)
LKTIVITGSTRGIGFGLAESFLDLGQRVVVSGRSRESVERALDLLRNQFPEGELVGIPCDMQDYSQVQALWDFAGQQFGSVDIWINNAGIGIPQIKFWELDQQSIVELIGTNVIGAMFGARVALAGFLKQGWGAFYNMEGLGSDGRQIEGLTLYGTSKRALNYLTDSLAAEVAGTGLIVGALSPGMVLTDLILKQYEGKDPEEWENARRIFNILSDTVETVTPFLAEKVLENTRNGARINWLTPGKVIWRFLTARLVGRDLLGEIDEGTV